MRSRPISLIQISIIMFVVILISSGCDRIGKKAQIPTMKIGLAFHDIDADKNEIGGPVFLNYKGKIFSYDEYVLYWSTYASQVTSTVPIAKVPINNSPFELFRIPDNTKYDSSKRYMLLFLRNKKSGTETFSGLRVEIIDKYDRSIKISTKVEEQKQDFKGKYYALIIGINDYSHLSKLYTAINDARKVTHVLSSRFGFKTTLLENAKREDILHNMNKLRKKLNPEDNLLIYYAGHGVFDKKADKAYWLPVDAQKDDDTSWIIVDTITSQIRRMSSNHILIVSDSCYAGTLTRTTNLDFEAKQTRQEYLLKMYDRSSRTLLASGGNEPVSDSGGEGHSVFAQSFLMGLLNMDKAIFTAEELYSEQIKEKVAGNAEQIPEYNIVRKSGHNGGDFIFIRQK